MALPRAAALKSHPSPSCAPLSDSCSLQWLCWLGQMVAREHLCPAGWFHVLICNSVHTPPHLPRVDAAATYLILCFILFLWLSFQVWPSLLFLSTSKVLDFPEDIRVVVSGRYKWPVPAFPHHTLYHLSYQKASPSNDPLPSGPMHAGQWHQIL